MYRISVAVVFLASLIAACSAERLPTLDVPVDMPAGAGDAVVGPRLETGADGVLRLSWMERQAEGARLRFMSLVDERWSDPVDVTSDPRMFVNWADLPSVNALPDGALVAHWLRYNANETYAYDVVMAFSHDRGATWSEPVSPHDDGTSTEHGFVSISARDGAAALLWLDGRDTGGAPSGSVLDTSMTLRAAEIGPAGMRTARQLVDDSVCDCCQTDVAVATAGPIGVYRNRTADEIRDIYITRFEAGRWQVGTPLHEDHWQISACPVNGPAIAAEGELVAVAWFTAANQRPRVQLKLSRDGGHTFGAPLEVAASRSKGRVGVALLPENVVAVSWVAKGPDDSDLVRVRLAAPDGRLGPAVTVGTSKLLRVYPQLANVGEELVVAWTDGAGELTRLVAKRISVLPQDQAAK